MKGKVLKDYPQFNIKQGDWVEGKLAVKDDAVGLYDLDKKRFILISDFEDEELKVKVDNSGIYINGENVTKQVKLLFFVLGTQNRIFDFAGKEYVLDVIKADLYKKFKEMTKLFFDAINEEKDRKE